MYATEQDLLIRFQGGTVQTGDIAIELALSDASELINTYLCKKYVLPFETAPNILKKLCVDLSCYFLATADEFVTEDIRRRHDAALATLRDLAKGIIDLPIQNDAIENDTNQENGAVLIQGAKRIFGRNKGF